MKQIAFGIEHQINFMLRYDPVDELDAVPRTHNGFPPLEDLPCLTLYVYVEDFANAQPGETRLRCRHRLLHLRQHDLRAEIDFREMSGEVHLHPLGALSNLYSLLRYLTSIRIFQNGGVVFHAAAVSDGDCGYVLVGPSGAGKTTAAEKLSTHAVIASDEWAPLVRSDAGFRLCRVPHWTSDAHLYAAGPNIDVPVNLIAVLDKGDTESLWRLPGALGVVSICGLPNVPEEIVSSERVLDSLDALCERVPVFRMESTKTGDIWPLLQAACKGEEGDDEHH